MKFGIERLLADPALRAPLTGKRVALLAHPASVTRDLTHSLDALAALGDIRLTAAFGPQHGLRGDKQDNMVESEDFIDAVHEIPVFSLYGEVRRPSGQSMSTFDTVLIDLQDVGCRIYTFITTLLYMLEAAAEHGKSVWVLDRPNPAGRPVEGLTLLPGWESFVGAGPMPMRHGLTLGELGHWFIHHFKIDVDYRVIEMEGYRPDEGPGFGWPAERVWINPSPNAPNLNMARCYAGTVMLEGAKLSEGRGTTRPLELFGAPDIDARAVIEVMRDLAPQWLTGCTLRDISFEPTFHKHVGELCSGVHIHAEGDAYDHAAFRPWRVQALAFKAIRALFPDYDLWRDFPYEYAFAKLPIDVINGGPALREWVDDAEAVPGDLDVLAMADEEAWREQRGSYLLYGDYAMVTSSEADLDRLLEREPRNIDALVRKGDIRAAAGDDRAASAFYKAAVAAASAATALPATLKPVIDRALIGLRRAEGLFLEYLEQALATAGFAPGSRPPRFQRALDLTLGRAEANPKLQRPTGFYYPGLEERPYYESSQFAWSGAIERAAASILAELRSAESGGHDDFTPYLVTDASRPRSDFHGLHDNPDWSTLQLWDKGRPADLAGHFPHTLAAVGATDLPRISVRAPNILFSKLTAGARIPPHHGMLNARLICHLPLVVPAGCGFRVGGETREWEEGKLLIFDDTIEHEAWNKGSSERVILIFDVWHPDLDEDEQRAITTMFEAIDGY